MAKQKEKSIYDEFEPTLVRVAKKITEKENVNLSSGSSDFLQLKDGTNKIRIFPKHSGEDHFMISVVNRWADIESDEKGKDSKRVKLPDGKEHGGLSKDPFELYIEYCAENLGDDAEDKKKLSKISASSFNGGLQPVTTWLMYAGVIKDEKIIAIEKFEVKKTLRDAINIEMYTEDDGEPIETDPFTHPRTGTPIIVTYNSKAKKASDYYSLKISKKPHALTEDELNRFKKMTPLSKLSSVNYTVENFETAVEAIRFIDEREDINLFDENFEEKLEELKNELLNGDNKDGKNNELPFNEDDNEDDNEEDDELEKQKSKKTKKQKSKKVEEDEDVEDEDVEEDDDDTDKGDKFDEMDRNELIKYKNKNGYDIKLLKSDSDDEMRNKLREVEQDETDGEDVEDEDVEDEEKEPEEKPKVKKGGALTLEEIKAKMKQGIKRK